MQVIKCEDAQQINAMPTALALGYFDGIHKGHTAVIQTAVDYAKRLGLCPAVFTFQRGIHQGGQKKQIISEEQKHTLLAQLGVEICYEPDFSSFKHLAPRDFFETYLIGKYHAKALFCGENYGFGKQRAGNTSHLAALCEEFGLHLQVLALSEQNGETLSSSRIRMALEQGDVGEAHQLLGRPYELCLPVIHGQGLGRSFGFPTINQQIPKERQAPAFGVYITNTCINGRHYASATGYGTRPTLAGEAPSCETFIPDFEGDVYGEIVCVRFYKYLSETRKFASVEELANAVQSWAKQAQAFFAEEHRK